MDNRGIDKEKFMSVWKRVSGETALPNKPPAPPAGGGDILAELIEKKTAAAADYTRLAGKTSGHYSGVLRTIAAEERQHLKVLQAAFFVKSGDTLKCTPPRGGGRESKSAALRKKYYDELAAAEMFTRAASETKDEYLKKQLEDIAAADKRHSMMIMKLIENTMS